MPRIIQVPSVRKNVGGHSPEWRGLIFYSSISVNLLQGDGI